MIADPKSVRMPRRSARSRRSFMLIEMLIVLLLVGIGGSLFTVGLGAILRSQQQVAHLSNRYAVLHDMMDHLRTDVRHATMVALHQSEDAPITSELTVHGLAESPGETAQPLVWRFANGRVERNRSKTTHTLAKVWDLGPSDLALSVDGGAEGRAPLVHMSITWLRETRKETTFRRRFDMTIRCAGELDYEDD